MSPSKEMSMGLSASEGIKKDNKANLDKDKALLKRVQTIGQKIARVANQPDFKWEFHVISKDVLNAFCLPGGKVYVYTGIAKVTQNDDQLATVMSHEIAHAIARHGAERVSMGQIVGTGQKLLSLIVNSKAPQYNKAFQSAYGYGSNLGLMLPFSRKHEMEADKIGLILMTKAGYDTKEASKFWVNMKKASGNSGKSKSDFFSTHPSDDKRIAQINEYNKKHYIMKNKQ
jgi:predicted Zn-dependent protease